MPQQQTYGFHITFHSIKKHRNTRNISLIVAISIDLLSQR